jgi:tyrosine-protein kinase Etk/Wzc
MNPLISKPNIMSSAGQDQDDDSLDLAPYLDLVLDNRWLIAVFTFAVTLVGCAYAFIATPIYESNILVQVEDSGTSSQAIFGDLATAFDLKSVATAEMEILRSRLVVTRAVQNAHLDLIVRPMYFPVFGRWISRRNNGLSDPGIFGLGGFAWGKEAAQISKFELPDSLEGERFTLEVTGADTYRLRQQQLGVEIAGRVGETAKSDTQQGTVSLRVDKLFAKPGAEFVIKRSPQLDTVEELQKALNIVEKGKQSGIIGVSLEGTDPDETAQILNEIGKEYIRQNVDRKSAEAEKSLAFLEKQLPEMKATLEKAEEKYNALRNRRGTINLDEEAKAILQQSVFSQAKMLELKQKRDELLTRYEAINPLVQAVEQQIQTLQAALNAVEARIKEMPNIEQDVLRLTRDVKVNTELYTSLLNSAQQLRLVKASKVGNARLLDNAVVPLHPIRPKRVLVVGLSAIIGLFIGLGAALIRRSLFGGIEDPSDVEQRLGLTVSAAVPHSDKQAKLYEDMGAGRNAGQSLLAVVDPNDLAIESLRSFRTSLQFLMLGAKNNIVMISGATPSVGKSFISANFASVLALTGKKVLLVDSDLRKGYLQKYFGLPRENGLSEFIAGQLSLGEVTHRGVVENVDFIATGTLPPRPAELMAHSRFSAFLDEASRKYDIVLIDTPPVLAVADALIIATQVGTIFSVARGGVSTIGEIEETRKRFEKSGAALSGVVFNGLRARGGSYGYGSKYGKYRFAQYTY